jgi:hypothetical protein
LVIRFVRSLYYFSPPFSAEIHRLRSSTLLLFSLVVDSAAKELEGGEDDRGETTTATTSNPHRLARYAS